MPWVTSTVSPGSPITRLMKSLFGSREIPRPSVSQWTNAETGDRWACTTGWGSENTMMSPRRGGWMWYTTLFTSTRSPTSSVCSIEPDGM